MDQDCQHGTTASLSIQCPECGKAVLLTALRPHRKTHEALAVLGFPPTAPPTRAEEIFEARRRVLDQRSQWRDTNLAEGDRLDSGGDLVTDLSALDAAVERLRGELSGDLPQTFAKDRSQAHAEVKCELLSQSGANTSPLSSVCPVGVAWSQNSLWRRALDDTFLFIPQLDGDGSPSLALVCDGYGTEHAARVTVDVLPASLSSSCADGLLQLDRADAKERAQAASRVFRKAFMEVEQALKTGKGEPRMHQRWSGCTAAAMIIDRENGQVHSANLGDVQVACFDMRLKQATMEWRMLSRLHSPMDIDERDRLHAVGVKINSQGKVGGLVRMSRALGFHGDQKLKKGLICKPHMSSMTTMGRLMSDEDVAASKPFGRSAGLDNESHTATELSDATAPHKSPTPTGRESTAGSSANIGEDINTEIEVHHPDGDEPFQNSGNTNDEDVAKKKHDESLQSSHRGLSHTISTGFQLPAHSSSAIVIATASLWELFSADQVSELISPLSRSFPSSLNGSTEPLDCETVTLSFASLVQSISKRLVEAALVVGSQDNITVMSIIV